MIFLNDAFRASYTFAIFVQRLTFRNFISILLLNRNIYIHVRNLSDSAMGLLTDKCQSKRKRSLFEKRNFLSYANEIQPLLDKMEKMGQNKGKTVAQIALNYVISKGVLPLAGSNSRSQLVQN